MIDIGPTIKKNMSSIREKAIAGLKVGDTFQVERTFTESDVIAFAGISRDYNPIHFEERFSAVKGMKGRICHGLLVGGMLTEIGGQLGWLASGMNFRFKKPVYFGDTVKCSLTITGIDSANKAAAEAVFYNQHGVRVLHADITGIIPGAAEQAVLKTLAAEGDPANKVLRK